MEWLRRQDVKDPPEVSRGPTPEGNEVCYFEEDGSIDEGMVRFQR